jgi:hypothetical protein
VCEGCARQVIGELRNALPSPLDSVKRTNIIEGARRLLESAFGTVNDERQCATAAISKARNVMPRLQQITRECRGTDARSARAQVGDEIRKGDIRFVSDRRDDWGCRGGNGTQHPLNIERTKVVTRATATRQQEHADGVGATAPSLLHGAGIDSCDCFRDLFRGAGALHRGMHHNQSSQWRLAA